MIRIRLAFWGALERAALAIAERAKRRHWYAISVRQ